MPRWHFLTSCVANVKQVLTILFSVSLFNLTITATNALGITLTLAGGAWYAWVEYEEKQWKARRSWNSVAAPPIPGEVQLMSANSPAVR